MNRAAPLRKSPRPVRTIRSGGVAFLPRFEQRDDGFGPHAVAPHDYLDDRIGKHFAKREFAIEQNEGAGFRARALH
jgi:hypothetical protein